MSNTKKTIEWIILIVLGSLIAISCEKSQLIDEGGIYPELQRAKGQAFPTTDGSQDYNQIVYLDTL